MNSHRFGKAFAFGVVLCILLGILCPTGLAQGLTLEAPQPSLEAPSLLSATAPEAPRQHKFLDRKNQALLAATMALNLADFSVTRANLQSGGRD